MLLRLPKGNKWKEEELRRMFCPLVQNDFVDGSSIRCDVLTIVLCGGQIKTC